MLVVPRPRERDMRRGEIFGSALLQPARSVCVSSERFFHSCLFRRRLLFLFLLFLDGGCAAGEHLRGVDRRGFVGGRFLFDVGNNAALVVSQLVDDSRHERPLVHVLLCITSHHHYYRHHHRQQKQQRQCIPKETFRLFTVRWECEDFSPSSAADIGHITQEYFTSAKEVMFSPVSLFVCLPAK